MPYFTILDHFLTPFVYCILFLLSISLNLKTIFIPQWATLFLDLAALVELYVQAINTPGVIPNVQSAWDTFVTDKCSEATHEAMNVYSAVMLSKLSNQLPCDSEEIRKCHETAFD